MKPRTILLPTLLAFGATINAQTPVSKPVPPETVKTAHGLYAEFPPALAEARRLKKDLLIDFGGSDWCQPCMLLKDHVFVKPEFIRPAEKQFVLVDIDDLKHGGISRERKARYEALETRYKVGSFPSVILATPEGDAYAWTTYSDATATPDKFFAHLQPLIARGRAFRDELAKASRLTGKAKIDAMVQGLSQVRPDLLWRFNQDKIEKLRALDPKDSSGLVSYLDARRAVENLENRLGQAYTVDKSVRTEDIDALIAKYHLKGEMLGQAYVMKAMILTIANRPTEALFCFDGMLKALAAPSPFDRGDFLPTTPASLALLRRRVDEGRAGGHVAQLFALHRIFEFEMPDRFVLSCGYSAFRPNWAVRKPLAEAYAQALIASTADLKGLDQAKALAKGLEDTLFLSTTSIRKIVTEIIPADAGAEAVNILPAYYRPWIADQPAPRAGG